MKAQKGRKSHASLILSLILAMLAALALTVIVGWEYGIGEWIEDFQRPVVKELDISGIHSNEAVLMRATGGKVIGSISGDEIIYPASLTKMMTAILAIKSIHNLDQEVLMTDPMYENLYESGATMAGFQSGEHVPVRELLYGALLPSGAECCNALAVTVSGSVEAFVQKMNDKAASLGMENTHFRNTTGLTDPEHFSTVYDMAILLKYCLRNRLFREIASTSAHTTAATDVHPDGITFYSTLFKHLTDPYVTDGRILGGKTGYTDLAGLCLASFAEIGGKEYILVTAGAPGDTGAQLHIEDAVEIYTRLGKAALALEEGSAP